MKYFDIASIASLTGNELRRVLEGVDLVVQTCDGIVMLSFEFLLCSLAVHRHLREDPMLDVSHPYLFLE